MAMSMERIHSPVVMADGAEANMIVPVLRPAGYYGIVLYGASENNRTYGQQYDDYTDGTLCAFTPESSVASRLFGHRRNDIRIVAFLPDMLQESLPGMTIDHYTFFGYRATEALHLSLREKCTIDACMDDIRNEACDWTAPYSKRILSKQIELLLDYCTRFYERQFTTRYLSVQNAIERYDTMIQDFISGHGFLSSAQLSAQDCSSQLGFSEAYFRDLLRQERGISHEEYLNLQFVSRAKRLLRTTRQPIFRIASDLGFPSERDFCLFFKKATGNSPSQFRHCC